MENNQDEVLRDVTRNEYKYGFYTDIETDTIPKGLNENIIRMISSKKNEPEWLLDFRLKAFKHWKKMTMPQWAHLDIPEIDYQDIIYYAAPKQKVRPESLDDVDPELKATLRYPGAPYRMSATPWKIAKRAPMAGEHNAEIYERELDLSAQEIVTLKESGTI